MPIIKSDVSTELEKVKFSITTNLYKEINNYCKWAEVKDIGIFFEQAAVFVLKKDTAWKKYKKSTQDKS